MDLDVDLAISGTQQHSLAFSGSGPRLSCLWNTTTQPWLVDRDVDSSLEHNNLTLVSVDRDVDLAVSGTHNTQPWLVDRDVDWALEHNNTALVLVDRDLELAVSGTQHSLGFSGSRRGLGTGTQQHSLG